MVIAWRAKAKKKPVITVSSAYSAGITDVQNRRGDTVKKTVAVDKYNKSINGVDRHDQYCVYYSFVRKTIKWWRKLFFYLLECSTVNSYILYKETCSAAGKKPVTSLEYRRSIIEALAQEHLQDSSSRPSVGRQRVGPTPNRLNRKLHLLDQRSTYRNCVVCSGETRHTTCYFCKTCPEQPALHPTTCFERYHTLQQYHI